jgi:hypothetical protein
MATIRTQCIDYLISRASMHGKTPLEVPWKFSHEYDYQPAQVVEDKRSMLQEH